MRMLVLAVSAATLILGACNNNDTTTADQGAEAPAVATDAPGLPAVEAPANEAIDTTNAAEPGAPEAGANSFTEAQASSRIMERGYTNVSELQKGEDGVWRGKAQKDGQTVDVALDFEGNVTP
jgi:hypothetical protein